VMAGTVTVSFVDPDATGDSSGRITLGEIEFPVALPTLFKADISSAGSTFDIDGLTLQPDASATATVTLAPLGISLDGSAGAPGPIATFDGLNSRGSAIAVTGDKASYEAFQHITADEVKAALSAVGRQLGQAARGSSQNVPLIEQDPGDLVQTDQVFDDVI